MLTLITFLIVLSILVFAHELGHFFVARKLGVKAEEFGFGFPPRAWGFYKNKEGKWKHIFGAKEVKDASDTIFSINWIPLGGFVKIKGEEGETAEDKDSFASRKIWQRASILSAGVSMNIILAAILISIGFMLGLPQSLDNLNPAAKISDKKIQVIDTLPESPAAKAEIKAGDIIVSINDKEFRNQDELQNFVNENNGLELSYKIKRGSDEIIKKITPVTISETSKGGIGVGIIETGVVKYPFFIAIWEGIKSTVFLTWAIIAAFYDFFKNLIFGLGMTGDIAGPVGIASLTGQVARMGFIYVLQFTALLSINLAIINFLPIPALDGGRVLFLIIEKIKGAPIKREVEAAIHRIGFALLMVLILFVTFRDVAKLGDKFKMIWEKFF
jgi:regulator of sigma E protease